MSSIINIAEEFNNPVELTVLPEGTEAELKIIGVKIGTDKNGNDYIMPKFEVQGQGDTVRDFSRYIKLPGKDMAPKDKASVMKQLILFGKCFGIDFSGPVEEDDMLGLTGWAILGIEKDQEGEDINRVSRFSAGQ